MPRCAIASRNACNSDFHRNGTSPSSFTCRGRGQPGGLSAMRPYEDDNHLKRFLLGNVTPEEDARLEDRLFDDDDFVCKLAVVEEELIDDYLCGRLTDEERF